MISARHNPLFGRYSSLFERTKTRFQNSRIAGIATMRSHKGTFSNLYIYGYFYRFRGFSITRRYSRYSAILGLTSSSRQRALRLLYEVFSDDYARSRRANLTTTREELASLVRATLAHGQISGIRLPSKIDKK